MNILINPFTLDGCQCRIKFDPTELQTLIHQRLEEKTRKGSKKLNQQEGELVMNGAFMEIDEGNFALHFMLAFLGKAKITCRTTVHRDGQLLLDEVLTASAMCSCFTPPKSQLKCDARLIADQLFKKTVKAIKES